MKYIELVDKTKKSIGKITFPSNNDMVINIIDDLPDITSKLEAYKSLVLREGARYRHGSYATKNDEKVHIRHIKNVTIDESEFIGAVADNISRMNFGNDLRVFAFINEIRNTEEL